MNTHVDLSQLAVDRSSSAARAGRHRHLATRYFLPAGLLFGVLALILWASRDLLSHLGTCRWSRCWPPGPRSN